MTPRERLLLALFFLSVVAAGGVSTRFLSGQVSASECSDTVDNDGDGKIDALSTMAPDPNASRTFAGPGGIDIIRFFYIEKAVMPYVDGVAVDDDPATIKKICEIAGYRTAASVTKRYFSSCGDNGVYYWNGSTWVIGSACSRDGHINTLVCKGKYAQCDDGLDNDSDGRIDMTDSGCSSATDNSEIPHDLDCTSAGIPFERPRQCQDGADNDADGKVDFGQDPDCDSALDDQETAQCRDAVDNDADGATDAPGDFSCTNADDNDETNPKSQCQDGIDNDNDGAADFPADFSCANSQDNDETNPIPQCNDGEDNDTDGAIDFPTDFSCADRQDNDETNPKSQCQDGLDNDTDGKKDLLDLACQNAQDNNERTQCNDSVDNDTDSAIDYPNDIGCTSIDDDNEASKYAQCQDGIDNDNDGAKDFPADVSCSGTQDEDEKNPVPECQDGLDNDQDGAIDAPADFSCGSKQDKDETLGKAECQDGQDNDGDGVFDLADPGCAGLQDGIESDEVCKEPVMLMYNLQPLPLPSSSNPKEFDDLRNLRYDITYHTRFSLPQFSTAFVNQFDTVWLLNGCADEDLTAAEVKIFKDFQAAGGNLILSVGDLRGKTGETAGDCMGRVNQISSLFGATFQGFRKEGAACKETDGAGTILNGATKLFRENPANIVQDASSALQINKTAEDDRSVIGFLEPANGKGGVVLLPVNAMLQGSCNGNQAYRNLFGMLNMRKGCTCQEVQDSSGCTQYGCNKMTTYNGQKYLFYRRTSNLTWQSAEAECVSKGGHLAAITSEQESTMLYSLIQGTTDVWIGLNRLADHSTMKWSTGEPLTYKNWYPLGQPDGTIEQYCSIMNHSLTPGSTWHDIACNDNRPQSYVCEIGGSAVCNVTQCSDGINNDNQDGMDLVDEGCSDITDNSEQDDITALQGGVCLLVSSGSTGSGQLNVQCPDEYVVVGGGWAGYTGKKQEGNDTSRPLPTGEGWECERNVTGTTAICQAICCSAQVLETKVISVAGPLKNDPQPTCPASYTVTAGGYIDKTFDKDEDILRPEGENAWHCYDDASVSAESMCYAICAKRKDTMEFSCTTEIIADAADKQSVACPAGTVAMGGGFVDNSTGNDDQDTSGPFLTGWLCADDKNDSPGATNTCYARCCAMPNLVMSLRSRSSSSAVSAVSTSATATSTSSSTATTSSARSSSTGTSRSSSASSVSSAATTSAKTSVPPSSSAASSVASTASVSSQLSSVQAQATSSDGAVAATEQSSVTAMDSSGSGGLGCTDDSACYLWEKCENGQCVNRFTIALETASSSPPSLVTLCGNARTEDQEECDDGNARDGDGCSRACELERGFCGDGIVERALGEQCEIALSPNDCTAQCHYILRSCGNGQKDPLEECDDGFKNSNLPGALCRSNCRLPRCGDAIRDEREACDDGNRINEDGCSSTCTKEQKTLAETVTVNIETFQPTTQTLVPVTAEVILHGGADHAPVGDTGPGALAVIAAGAGTGLALVRRRKAKKDLI